MMRLLAGSNQLRENYDTNIPYNERVCTLCNGGEVEDLFHMVMNCIVYRDIREMLFQNLHNELTEESFRTLVSLPTRIIFYIIMGMDFPLCRGDIWRVRCISCRFVSKMYELRQKVGQDS